MLPNLMKRALGGGLCFIALLVPAPAGDRAYQVSAWTFGDETSLDGAVARDAVDEVNVDWYQSRRNGSLDTSAENMSYVALAHGKGLRVLATVSNYSQRLGDFDSRLAHYILATPERRNRHAANICKLCVEKGFDGVDLDWESVFRGDRNRFTRFVRVLAAKLHNRGKILSIAVHAKTSDPGGWFGAKAEDYAKLGAVVDEFKIMTYDYSGSWSEPGPVAPPAWADAVLTFAESVIPSAKIMMGIPFYGYDWTGEGAEYLLWTDVQSLISTYTPTIGRDVSGEATFQYTDGSGNLHTVFFQDRPAIQAKLEMLRSLHPNIRGIAIWCMGGESNGFWDEIASQLAPSQ
jgi:spore germination protein